MEKQREELVKIINSINDTHILRRIYLIALVIVQSQG